MNAYDEIFLDDAMQNLADMVDYAVCDLEFDPDEFFSLFIVSGIASQFERGNPKYVCGMSGYELADAVLCKVNISYKAKEPSYSLTKGREYWTGWILAYYQWLTNQRFKDIVKNGLTLSTVLSMYILHEADESKFFDCANEIIERNKKNRNPRLYGIRKARGFTQRQLSDASDVSIRTIRHYEQKKNDIRKAQLYVVLNLSKALGCDIEDLID